MKILNVSTSSVVKTTIGDFIVVDGEISEWYSYETKTWMPYEYRHLISIEEHAAIVTAGS